MGQACCASRHGTGLVGFSLCCGCASLSTPSVFCSLRADDLLLDCVFILRPSFWTFLTRIPSRLATEDWTQQKSL
eukprot:2487682-Rhodomonas_salina.1